MNNKPYLSWFSLGLLASATAFITTPAAAVLSANTLATDGNLSRDMAQIPGGPPTGDPSTGGPPNGNPLPNPDIIWTNPDPFPDLPTDTLPFPSEDPEFNNNTLLTIEGDWAGEPLAASGALTEVAVLTSFLPEPLLTIGLTPTGNGNSAAGGGSNAPNTVTAPGQPVEGEPQPPEGVDVFEPTDELPPEAEMPDAPIPEPGEIEPGEPIAEAPETSENGSDAAAGDTSANAESSAQQPKCQKQVRAIQTAEGEMEDAHAVYQSLADCYQQILDNAIATNNTTHEILSLNNLAITQFVMGNYLEAKALHERQRVLALEQGETTQAGIAQSGIGAAYAALGDYAAAIANYEASLPQLSAIRAPKWRSLTLRNLGNAYYAQQNFAQAQAYQQQSLQLSQGSGDRYGEMQALGNLGNFFAISGEHDTAISSYRQALALAQALNHPIEEAQIFLGLGTTYYYLQEFETAYDYYQQSVALSRQLGARLGEGIALSNMGETLSRLDRLPAAETALYESVSIWESLQAGLGNNDAFKVSLFETQKAAYRNLQEVLVKRDKLSDALELSERGRTRAFVELLGSGDEPGSNAAVAAAAIAPPKLAELRQVAIANQVTLVEYAIIRDQFARIPHGASPQRAAASETTQPQASNLYIWVIQPTGEIEFRQVDLQSSGVSIGQLVEESRQQLRSGSDRAISTGSSTRTVNPNTLRIGDFVRRQGDPSTLAPYEVIAIDPATNTVTVTHPDITLPNPNLPISDLLSVDTTASSGGSPTSESQTESLQQLHQLLIAPIKNLLPTAPNAPIVFIPQEQLFLVPFAALKNAEGTDFIEQHTPLSAPSIQALSLIRPSSTPRRQNPLIVGNPSPMPQSLAPLPHAETEAIAIGQSLSVSPLTQATATESAIKQQLPTAGLIHLATHGFFNESNPLQGSLALAPNNSTNGQTEDGFLTVAEILERPLTAQLVILSACDTGRGRITGDGVIGLSRSFLAAGAARVIVSLWQVPDEATSSLMVEFYNQLQQGNSEAQALRQAMLITRETHPNPHDWAAFTFIGDSSPSQ